MAIAATPALAGETATYGGVPDVELTYYDVSGRTPEQIRAAIDRLRPTDSNDGKRVDALTRNHFQWRWPIINGVCDLRRATVEFHASVTLPRLVNVSSLSDGIQREWTRYLAGIEEHEKGHLLNAWTRRDDVLTAIKNATCDTANDAAKAVLKEINQADVDYDRRTDHGRRQGATF